MEGFGHADSADLPDFAGGIVSLGGRFFVHANSADITDLAMITDKTTSDT